MKRRAWTIVLGLGISAGFIVRSAFSQGQTPAQRRVINLPGKLVQAPVSDAVLVGDTLYLSGKVGLDPKTGKTPDNIDDELNNMFNSYKATLAAAGMTMDDLVYVQVFCTDLSLYDKFNAAYRGQFAKDFPARAFIGAGSLFRGGHFELQGIAIRR